jgi:hypothetical protein
MRSGPTPLCLQASMIYATDAARLKDRLPSTSVDKLPGTTRNSSTPRETASRPAVAAAKRVSSPLCLSPHANASSTTSLYSGVSTAFKTIVGLVVQSTACEAPPRQDARVADHRCPLRVVDPASMPRPFPLDVDPSCCGKRCETAFLSPPRALLCLARGQSDRVFPAAPPRTSPPPPRSQKGEPSAPRHASPRSITIKPVR